MTKPCCGGQVLDAAQASFKAALAKPQCMQYALNKPGVVTVLPGYGSQPAMEEVQAFFDTTPAERDYSAISAYAPQEALTKCVYCQPCPVGLEIGLINKYYEDPTLVAYGEDVRDWGGAYAVYRGLMDVIPHSRLCNSPISEAAIVGTAVGDSMCGGRAVVELMYCDFLGRAGDEVFNQMSKWQAMSAGILKMPMIVRMSVGAKYGAQHSQDWVAIVSHIPGLKVFFPATPYEAKGIMQAALNGTDPCVIFESQRIYGKGEEFHEGGVPAEEYEWAPGAVNKVRDGKDLTILTIGATLYRAVDAAKTLSEKYGVEADVINMPSLVPLDYTDLIASVKKTGRVVLASDACARGTFLNEIAENLTNMCFDYLDAPPVVIGARNWITPPHEFDKYFFPYAEWIIDAVNARLLPLKGYESKTTPSDDEVIRRNKLGV